ncbi:hypothetical protein [Pseudanabaena sp. PCC 6802]|uniref:hypothetical protein n=1 Tax=Pseudanabaena sp. PCC 6802 TaxID=118173 RepID=UPI00034DCACA|nr:hypothetical protein [Pseudanabaena sp. PCC 6802]
MKFYKPSNKVPSSGYTWLALTALIGGLAIGGATFAVARLIYLWFLFPIAMGFGGGFLQAYAVKQGKVRSPLGATGFAVLMGLVIYGTLNAGYYLAFRQEVAEEQRKNPGQSDPNQIDSFIDRELEQTTGSNGFWGYMKLRASVGESLKIGRSSSSKLELKNEWAWGYWAIELAAISGIIAVMAFAAAKEPFCEESNEWYLPKTLIGSVPQSESENFLTLIKNDNFVKAGALIDPQNQFPIPNLAIHVQRSPGSNINDLILEASRTSLDNKGNVSFKLAIQGMISPAQYAQLEQALNQNLPQASDAPNASDVSDRQPGLET